MSAILIRDLAQSRELDAAAMSPVRGGANSWLQGLGPAANVNVNVGVSQNLMQFQNVEVNALNNVGIIGAGFGPLRLNVSPTQAGALPVVF
jgi:hypothetical protein